MGRADIWELLKTTYPKWLSCDDISETLGINRTNVNRVLRQFKKDPDIEYTMEWGSNDRSSWITRFRIKKEQVK